jgi:hypothetical protein
MISNTLEEQPVIKINFLPSKFSANKVKGYILNYDNNDQLRKLQDEYYGKMVLRRFGNVINAVPVMGGVSVDGVETEFDAGKHWKIFKALLEEGVRLALTKLYPTLPIPKFGNIVFDVVGTANDLFKASLIEAHIKSSGIDFVSIYRKYSISAESLSRVGATSLFGVSIKVSTHWKITANIGTLRKKGVNVVGAYAVPLNTIDEKKSIGLRTIGKIARIEQDSAFLVDSRDADAININDYTIEASLENVTKCARAIIGEQSRQLMGSVRNELSKVLSAEGQLKRISQIAGALSKAPILCAVNLSANFENDCLDIHFENTPKVLKAPKYIMKSGREPVSGSISSALSSQGPYDQDYFEKTSPFILVITPKEYQGQIEQFLRQWRDGGAGASFQKGFLKQYRLRNCELHFEDFSLSSSPSEDYRQACVNALEKSRRMIRRFDLAFVVIREQHRLLGANDPYIIVKAALMNEGIPVQEIEAETINSVPSSLPYILNNIALASYAKMGGTPWLLASSKGQGITHELIVGMGSTIIKDGRFDSERYVGITTLFNYDGVYLVSNVSKESPFEEYSLALKSVLLSSVKRVSLQKGWQKGDRVRIIFHTFKPLKNIEIETAKALVKENLPDFDVDFAFLEIGQYHDWMAYDTKSPGITTRSDKKKGEKIPQRGCFVMLDKYRSLLSITGPSELKLEENGCPSPLQIKLNPASTFQDINYLAEQVFDFTYISWKAFNLSPLPVTILYSEAIAKLLGRLRKVKNWNADILQTTDLNSSLWFL